MKILRAQTTVSALEPQARRAENQHDLDNGAVDEVAGM
jgi:hypothetical protein